MLLEYWRGVTEQESLPGQGPSTALCLAHERPWGGGSPVWSGEEWGHEVRVSGWEGRKEEYIPMLTLFAPSSSASNLEYVHTTVLMAGCIKKGIRGRLGPSPK